MATSDNEPRIRSSGAFYPSSVQKWAWWNEGDATINWSTATVANSRGSIDTISDVVTKRYAERSKRGEIFNKPCVITRHTKAHDSTGPMFIYTNPVTGKHSYGDLQGPHWTAGSISAASHPTNRPAYPDDLKSQIALASTDAWSNIAPPDFQGLVTLGELRETLRYLRNPVAGGLKLADTIAAYARKKRITRRISGKTRRDQLIGERDLAKDIADIHLSIIYGAKPLIKEVTGALDTLRPRELPRPERKTSRGKQVRKYNDTWSVLETKAGFTYTATYVHTRTVTVRCGILYEYKVVQSGQERWGLRPRDVIPALVAVAPLSFVLDWFVNLSSFIGALIPSADTALLARFTTIKIEEELIRTWSGYSLPQSGWSTARDGQGKESFKTVSYERIPWVDVPQLATQDLSGLRNDVSRLTSMISLLTTRLSSIGKSNPPLLVPPRRPGRALRPEQWGGL